MIKPSMRLMRKVVRRLKRGGGNPVSMLGMMIRLARYGSPDPESLWGVRFDTSKARPVQVGNATLYVMPEDFIGASILVAREYEPHVTRVIRERLSKGDVFVDIGANVGWFALVAAQLVGDRGHVYAIEGLPQNVELIRKSVQASRLTDRVTVIGSAASDTKGQLRFTNVGSDGGVIMNLAPKHVSYLTVDCDTIDNMLNGVDIAVIKMDVEAHEPYVLDGMAATIERCRPTIVTEFHPWALKLNNPQPPIEFLQSLVSHAYRIKVIDPLGKLSEPYTPEEVMALHEQQDDDKIHMDLLCEPLD